MNIPIDEMLTELRAVLEAFDNEPSAATLDNVFKETMRINDVCEDVYLEAEDEHPLN